MVALRLRRGLSLSVLGLALSVAAEAAAADPPAEAPAEPSVSTPKTPTLQIAPTFLYGSIRQDAIRAMADAGAPKRAQSYGGLQLAVRLRATSLLSLGIVASHAECDGCEGARFSRVSFEAGLHPIHGRFIDAWGSGALGLAFAKFAPVQPSLCVNGNTTDCAPLYTDDQKRTRLGPEAGVGIGVDFLPIPYVSLGVESRAMAVLFDASRGVPAPGGLTPAVFAGLTLAAHIPLR
jgi:hypothetical protein